MYDIRLGMLTQSDLDHLLDKLSAAPGVERLKFKSLHYPTMYVTVGYDLGNHIYVGESAYSMNEAGRKWICEVLGYWNRDRLLEIVDYRTYRLLWFVYTGELLSVGG